MHAYLSNKARPFAIARYAISVGEIASTTNEGLLRAFFRQAMFAEFEQRVHGMVDAGQSLTGEQLTKIYVEILRRYHGEAQGVVKTDDLYAIEWAWIPHFYNRIMDEIEAILVRRKPG